jgi:hypothetical protein
MLGSIILSIVLTVLTISTLHGTGHVTIGREALKLTELDVIKSHMNDMSTNFLDALYIVGDSRKLSASRCGSIIAESNVRSKKFAEQIDTEGCRVSHIWGSLEVSNANVTYSLDDGSYTRQWLDHQSRMNANFLDITAKIAEIRTYINRVDERGAKQVEHLLRGE